MAKIGYFFIFLFEVKFNEFKVFCQMNKEDLTVDKSSPVVDPFKFESGLNRGYLYAVQVVFQLASFLCQSLEEEVTGLSLIHI